MQLVAVLGNGLPPDIVDYIWRLMASGTTGTGLASVVADSIPVKATSLGIDSSKHNKLCVPATRASIAGERRGGVLQQCTIIRREG